MGRREKHPLYDADVKMRPRQSKRVRRPFEELIKFVCPEQIIELGTGNGLFTNWLAERFANVKVLSFDRLPPPKIVDLPNYKWEKADILGDSEWLIRMIDVIKEVEGRTILLCDNGDKVKEMQMFAPHLKAGDIIMCHDYTLNLRWWRKNDRPWRTVEVMQSDLEWMNINVDWMPFLERSMLRVGWGCFLKIRYDK